MSVRSIVFIPGRTNQRSSTAEMLYIHPDECIDCGACVPACPVEAIFALDETPAQVGGLHPDECGVLSIGARDG